LPVPELSPINNGIERTKVKKQKLIKLGYNGGKKDCMFCGIVCWKFFLPEPKKTNNLFFS